MAIFLVFRMHRFVPSLAFRSIPSSSLCVQPTLRRAFSTRRTAFVARSSNDFDRRIRALEQSQGQLSTKLHSHHAASQVQNFGAFAGAHEQKFDDQDDVEFNELITHLKQLESKVDSYTAEVTQSTWANMISLVRSSSGALLATIVIGISGFVVSVGTLLLMHGERLGALETPSPKSQGDD